VSIITLHTNLPTTTVKKIDGIYTYIVDLICNKGAKATQWVKEFQQILLE
jgi:hypothetical protein